MKKLIMFVGSVLLMGGLMMSCGNKAASTDEAVEDVTVETVEEVKEPVVEETPVAEETAPVEKPAAKPAATAKPAPAPKAEETPAPAPAPVVEEAPAPAPVEEAPKQMTLDERREAAKAEAAAKRRAELQGNN